MRSVPIRATERVISWIGKGVTIPTRSSASAISGSTPSSLKVVSALACSVGRQRLIGRGQPEVLALRAAPRGRRLEAILSVGSAHGRTDAARDSRTGVGSGLDGDHVALPGRRPAGGGRRGGVRGSRLPRRRGGPAGSGRVRRALRLRAPRRGRPAGP